MPGSQGREYNGQEPAYSARHAILHSSGARKHPTLFDTIVGAKEFPRRSIPRMTLLCKVLLVFALRSAPNRGASPG